MAPSRLKVILTLVVSIALVAPTLAFAGDSEVLLEFIRNIASERRDIPSVRDIDFSSSEMQSLRAQAVDKIRTYLLKPPTRALFTDPEGAVHLIGLLFHWKEGRKEEEVYLASLLFPESGLSSTSRELAIRILSEIHPWKADAPWLGLMKQSVSGKNFGIRLLAAELIFSRIQGDPALAHPYLQKGFWGNFVFGLDRLSTILQRAIQRQVNPGRYRAHQEYLIRTFALLESMEAFLRNASKDSNPDVVLRAISLLAYYPLLSFETLEQLHAVASNNDVRFREAKEIAGVWFLRHSIAALERRAEGVDSDSSELSNCMMNLLRLQRNELF